MEKEIFDTLEELINFKSVSEDYKQTDALIDLIASKMNPNLWMKKHKFNHFSTLVISNTNSKKFDVVFCVHIDVVPDLTYQYKKVDDIIYGRGAIDMKGAVSVCITLMNHLDTEKKVALFITSDEEIDGNCAKQLVNLYPDIKLAIIPDGGSNFDFITEEKGLLQLKLETNTVSAHASTPYLGENAITKLYECYEMLLKNYPLLKSENDYQTSITLSKLTGGDAYNRVPSQASMILDIRLISKDKKEDILSLLQNNFHDIKTYIMTEGPCFYTDPKHPNILSYLDSCKQVLGFQPKQIKISSTSDAIYFSEKKIPTVIMNPIGGNPHSKDEYVKASSLISLYQIYEHFLKEGEIK